MTDKSYVTLERQLCQVCGSAFDTGALLLDKRLRPRFDRYTCTGFGLCPEHQRLHDEGYIALVECDPNRSDVAQSTTHIKPEQAYRTGRLLHLKREVFRKLFDMDCPNTQPMVFIEPGLIERLQELQEKRTASGAAVRLTHPIPARRIAGVERQ